MNEAELGVNEDAPAGDEARDDATASAGLDGLLDAMQTAKRPQDTRRAVFARLENSRHLRHEQVLARWPVLPEAWARRVDRARIESVDRTPGAATFGR